MITQKRRDMPSVCFQGVEALVITIGAINQNKIKDRLSGCWKLGEPIFYMDWGRDR